MLFRDSVGVNLHVPDDSTPYATQWPAVLALLKTSGIAHFRDSAWPTTWGDYARIHAAHLDLTAIGKLCLLWNVQYDATLLAELVALPDMEPGLEYLEGPNELDLSGAAGWAAEYDAALEMLATARPKAAILAPSLTQPGSPAQVLNPRGYIDFANLHVYWSGRPPETAGWGGPDAQGDGYGGLAWNLDAFSFGLPIVMTETGYGTDVPVQVRVQYLARLLVNNFAHGIVRTYLYQFVASGTDAYATYGLVNDDLSVRPDYTAVQSLITAIGDATITPTPSWIQPPAGVSVLCFTKANGNPGAVMWQSAALCDPNTFALTPPAPITLPLPSSLPPVQRQVLQYDGTLKTDIVTGSFALDDKVAILLE